MCHGGRDARRGNPLNSDRDHREDRAGWPPGVVVDRLLCCAKLGLPVAIPPVLWFRSKF